MSVRQAAPNRPKPVRVIADDDGVPLRVDGVGIEEITDDWLVEDRWWTSGPIRRRYWQALTARGRLLVVYHDLATGHWYSQAS